MGDNFIGDWDPDRRVSEFAFELELCAHLESDADVPLPAESLLARQLGASVADPGGRVLDVVCVEPGPRFNERTAISSERIPDHAIEAGVGPGRYRYWKRAFDCHPETARRATERALEIGFYEADRRRGREYVRQVARYPDWYDRIVGLENKPDLGRPGDLATQLRTDVSLALVDEIVLVTASYVTGAHLHRLPDPVGVWRFDPEKRSITVVREPTPLAVDEPGIEPLAAHPGETEIAVVDAEAKARTRRRIAERAYGKGWRTFAFPGCANCDPEVAGGATLPHCEWAGRVVDANSECGPACPGYQSADVPDVDLAAERDREAPWVAEPSGKRRRQSGLDRFG